MSCAQNPQPAQPELDNELIGRIITMPVTRRRNVGDAESITVTISREMVNQYAVLMNDTNPIHIDPIAGQGSIFGCNIAHGMLVGGLFGPLVVNQLLGPGVLYRKQTLEFDAPVPVDAEVTATITVAETKFKDDKDIYILKTECHLTENGQRVIQGEAVIIVPHSHQDKA
jgi:acyl dehydratase